MRALRWQTRTSAINRIDCIVTTRRSSIERECANNIWRTSPVGAQEHNYDVIIDVTEYSAVSFLLNTSSDHSEVFIIYVASIIYSIQTRFLHTSRDHDVIGISFLY